MKKILIAWSGLPFYGARCIAAFRQLYPDVRLVVFATEANLPLLDIEKQSGGPVSCLDPDSELNESLKNAVKDSNLVITCGWATPIFNRISEFAYSSGIPIVLTADNNWKGTFRQGLGAIAYRLRHRKKFSAVWVPGRSGRKLFRFYGVPDKHIYDGLYAADDQVFGGGMKISEREKKLLFVGQLIERKGVLRLCEAFQRLCEDGENRGYELLIAGTGHLEDAVKHYARVSEAIHYHGFVQPEQLAEQLRNVRALVLPSFEEHWGLVCHEAALSGCILSLSSKVGALPDFLPQDDPAIMGNLEVDEIRRALTNVINMPEGEMNIKSELMKKGASQFSTKKWCETLNLIFLTYSG